MSYSIEFHSLTRRRVVPGVIRSARFSSKNHRNKHKKTVIFLCRSIHAITSSVLIHFLTWTFKNQWPSDRKNTWKSTLASSKCTKTRPLHFWNSLNSTETPSNRRKTKTIRWERGQHAKNHSHGVKSGRRCGMTSSTAQIGVDPTKSEIY